ncbi:MBL fold metallo-hydrolase [Archaeoglobales archaeon ex4484_92]|nr:MAG: MBL fold metallo-hydrolase [Archaeoglobales archaeon ex4484_92]
MKPIRIIAPPLAANCYLLLDKRKALIDVGGDPEFIIKSIKKYIDLKDLDFVFLTHSHFDHAAAAFILEEIAEIVIHEEEYKFVKNYNFKSIIFGIKYKPFKPSILVKGGETFELGDIELHIIHTPGHSPGSICLYEPKKKWLFSGDTVFAYGSFGRVDLLGGDATKLIKSLETISNLDVENLYPGHEEVIEGNANLHISRSLRIAKSFL